MLYDWRMHYTTLCCVTKKGDSYNRILMYLITLAPPSLVCGGLSTI